MDTTILKKPESIEILVQKLKKDLSVFSVKTTTLKAELESAAKHLPAYLKIVKTHIEQLSIVLSLDTHNNRTLETAGLADPVIQLIKLFHLLEEDDLSTIEELAITAKSYNLETNALTAETVESNAAAIS